MKTFDLYLTSLVAHKFNSPIKEELLNILLQKNFDAKKTKVESKDNTVTIKSANEIIRIISDSKDAVILEEESVILDDNSIFNGCSLDRTSSLDSDGLDVIQNIYSDDSIYTAELWHADNKYLGNVTDSYHINSKQIELDALSKMDKEIKENNLTLYFAIKELNKELNEFVINNIEIRDRHYIRK